VKRLILALAALAVVGVVAAACVPPPPAPVPHANSYNTEVHIAPSSVAGSYTVDTACVLETGVTSTHTDTLTHVIGEETIKKFTWPEPDPVDCTATETAGPPMTTPSYWLTGTAPAPFGTPPTWIALTSPTPTPQTCHQTIIGTYLNLTPPLDYWDCIFTVQNT
jgi:hypothetical protein